MKHPPKSATPSERRQVERTHPALVLLQAAEGVAAPIGVLTALLAQTLAAGFGDSVLVVHLGRSSESEDAHRGGWQSGPPSLSPSTSISGPTSRTPSIDVDRGPLHHLDLPLPADPRRAGAKLRDKLRELVPRYAYIFIDASDREAALGRFLVEELASPELQAAVRRLVFLTQGAALPADLPAAWSVLITQLLQPMREEEAPPSLRAGRAKARRPWTGIVERVDAGRRMVRRLGERLGGEAIEPQGEPHPEARRIPELCRVRLDLPALAALRIAPIRVDGAQTVANPTALGRLPEAARQSLARWARALTWRRVGVALGGSGAWGYAHVALMRQLEMRGVPIDLVGGSSSGSVMGAYYSVLGRAGLDLVVERGHLFTRLALLSMVSSTVIDLGVDADLGSPLIEDLEILFLPVATNLSRGRAEVITRSTVPSAVRASSSAPGLFASTITRTGLYVDGAISDNVPVLLVERMGADLLVACNPLPPPELVKLHLPASPFGDFLAELNPFQRMRDLWVSFELMFHDFGDSEAADTRIVYDPLPDSGALVETFRFDRARELVAAVEREPRFIATVDRSVEAYRRLAAPRAP